MNSIGPIALRTCSRDSSPAVWIRFFGANSFKVFGEAYAPLLHGTAVLLGFG